MNVIDAADATVHDYPGGSEPLAIRLGMTGAVLRNKVNANNDRNHLTLAEADRLMSVTGDHRVLQALAASHGYALAPIDESAGRCNESIVGLLLKLDIAGGEFSRTIQEALDDGVITPNEMMAIYAAGHANQAALIGLIARLTSAAKRGPLRSASGSRAEAC